MSRPNSAYSDNHGYHNWYKLGDVGEKVFYCKKCGVKAYLRSRPSSPGCPSAKGGFHEWFSY